MNRKWNDNQENSILDECPGKTLLVRFKDKHNGISHTDEELGVDYSIDLSWLRVDGNVCATTGKYDSSDIDAWAEI